MTITRGIVLAGGAGTRLHPITLGPSKQLLPVYNKPMIYYPLSVLMLAGIREILIITTPDDQPQFKRLLGDGTQWGVRFQYTVQPSPDGLAQAFILGRDFLQSGPSALVLGDNLFFGHSLPEMLARAVTRAKGATIFAHHVEDPTRYGVVTIDDHGRATAIEEKPADPKSHWAATGLYFYDERICDIAAKVKPSARGELEITAVNQAYLEMGELHVELMGRGFAWLDTGTHDALLDAANLVQVIERRQGLSIASLEEIAYRQGWIDKPRLIDLAKKLGRTPYAEYLRRVADEPASPKA
ncbi:MAG TPA: glucose-1-phosphate thymidylyltransferase RfbA [Bradyrhizobium sp.]|nr:glucose-1-phosphate thymidylyltransferase RfbA [Bradyrhizobium sp.]